jgi:hypothetical protein
MREPPKYKLFRTAPFKNKIRLVNIYFEMENCLAIHPSFFLSIRGYIYNIVKLKMI